MSFEELLDRTATITRRTQTGALGRYNVPDWEDVDTEGVPYARQQRTADENLDESETQTATFELFFGIDTDVDGSDIVTDEVDGIVLEVVGPPKRLEYGTVPHIEATARATDQQEAFT